MQQGLTYDFAKVIAAAKPLMTSLCSIQAPTGGLGASGAPTGAYTPVGGLQNIPCLNAPLSSGNIQATEVKELADIESLSLRHVLLNGYYAQLDGQNWGDVGWRAIVDGVTYDLLGAERDSQLSQTRLKIRLVTL